VKNGVCKDGFEDGDNGGEVVGKLEVSDLS